jgi:hypothetical protein
MPSVVVGVVLIGQCAAKRNRQTRTSPSRKNKERRSVAGTAFVLSLYPNYKRDGNFVKTLMSNFANYIFSCFAGTQFVGVHPKPDLF